MAGVQDGLEVAFYLYPCGLFAALLVSQSVAYYRDRRRVNLGSSPVSNTNEKDAEKISRVYNWLIWVTQLLLCVLLASQYSLYVPKHHANLCLLTQLPNIVLVVRDAIGREDDNSKTAFPFSAYLVSLIQSNLLQLLHDSQSMPRLLMSVFYYTF